MKNRFLLPTVALIVVGMGLSSILSYTMSRSALTRTITGQLEQQAKSTTIYLGNWMRDRTLDIGTWSKDKTYRASVQDSFIGKAARKSASDQLAELKKLYPFYENICVATTTGDIVAAADDVVVGKVNVKDRGYFTAALKGAPAISDVITSRGTGNAIIVTAEPIFEKETVSGVFFGVVNLTYFSNQFVAPIKVGDTGYAYIVNGKGMVIAHPDPALIMKLNISENDFGRRILSQDRGMLEYTFGDVEKLAAFERENRFGWTVVVTAPSDEIMAPVRTIGLMNLGVGLAVVVVAIILMMLLVRSVVTPINRTVKGLNESAQQVGTASAQVASASQTLASGASEQAASLEESSASLEEMATMTRQNADNAAQADNLMQETRAIVDAANEAMTRLTASMAEISNASDETSKIIKTIDEIAFQTNLLALNAAVEAARAGEAGAGFAVVADEVRNLAMRAAEAARNTSALIASTGKKVDAGSDLVGRTNGAFVQVADSAGKVGELVAEIAAASREQAEGITQVNRAVVEMDKLTQQNAASAEESASASEEMSAQAEQMTDLIGKLKYLVDGQRDEMRTALKTTRKRSLSATAVRVSRRRSAARSEVSPAKVLPLDDDEAFHDF
ncbi:MAG: methyl-accepting chemotaxis protein [Pseudomonadota bacterium]